MENLLRAVFFLLPYLFITQVSSTLGADPLCKKALQQATPRFSFVLKKNNLIIHDLKWNNTAIARVRLKKEGGWNYAGFIFDSTYTQSELERRKQLKENKLIKDEIHKLTHNLYTHSKLGLSAYYRIVKGFKEVFFETQSGFAFFSVETGMLTEEVPITLPDLNPKLNSGTQHIIKNMLSDYLANFNSADPRTTPVLTDSVTLKDGSRIAHPLE